eukprot:CAMPEP_0177689464 /NCGR_PEP_ID=MMETSP0484_2-20121128/213_1 /TAXON_ID=354590 /ORGANISM="Rhodomonas lens, Strain RHODO" /LENGTH=60 /DNA_ID=CAMNT_0019199875 /DNA_START=17 /DNA_END=199 /DNA_ORIENTATION=+
MIEWIVIGGLAAAPAIILMMEGNDTAPCQAPRTKDIPSYKEPPVPVYSQSKPVSQQTVQV